MLGMYKNNRGSVSLYVILAMTIVTIVTTLYLRSVIVDKSSFNKNKSKIESEYIAQHGLTLVKETIYEILLGKKELDMEKEGTEKELYKRELSIPNIENVALRVEASIKTWDKENKKHTLGEKTKEYKLKNIGGGGKLEGMLYGNHPQIQDIYEEMKGKTEQGLLESTATYGYTGIAKITGGFNETTLVPDYYIVSLSEDRKEMIIHGYNNILTPESLELVAKISIEDIYKKDIKIPKLKELEWCDDVLVQAVYDKGIGAMQLYIGIKREKGVDIFLYEPYSTGGETFSYLDTLTTATGVDQATMNGVYSEGMNTVELVLTILQGKTITTKSFLPMIPSLGFEEVGKNTYKVDNVKAMDTGYVWSESMSTGVLVYGVITEKEGVSEVTIYENYPHMSGEIQEILKVDKGWDVFKGNLQTYNIAITLVPEEVVGSTTLIVALGDESNNRITTHKGYLELGGWSQTSHKGIELPRDTKGVGRINLAGVGGDFSQVILLNPIPIMEEVSYRISEISILGESYNPDKRIEAITKYKPIIDVIYEEPEFKGTREIIQYKTIKLKKDFKVVD